MNPYKERLATDRPERTLAEALTGADVFVGLSVAGCVTAEMVRSMAERPIIFAMANPDPEITYEAALAARPDVIMATGRSDYPNQVNNVLGFPFIFRGALDVRATHINQEMKLAATRALAALAKEDVPDSVMKAYGLTKLHFGPEYLIPKPFDHRVLIWEASAVAEAAMATGVARKRIDITTYREELESRLGKARHVMRFVINRAKRDPKRVVFPEGSHPKILRACQIVLDEGFARPILLGNAERIRTFAEEYDLDLEGISIVDPSRSDRLEAYAREYFRLRQRKGLTLGEARRAIANPTAWGAMMVHLGEADALVAGVTQSYPETIRPALRIIRMRRDVSRVAGVFLMLVRDELYFFADPTVNIDPTAEELADIAICCADEARRFDVEPRVAMLSFSNFGSVSHPLVAKVRRAAELVRERRPELTVDGEMQADTAVVPEIVEEFFPFSRLSKRANVLIFPDLQSANTAYKLLHRLGGAKAIGPILMGLSRPVQLLEQSSEVEDVVHMAAIAVVDAQEAEAPLAAPVETPTEAALATPA